MDLKLKGQVAIVTASSKGLGKATALQLALEGAKVAISSRNQEELERTAKEIREASGQPVLIVPSDVTKAEDIENLVNRTVEEFGGVDILINNAGGPPAGTFDDFSDADWIRAFELNLLSFIRTIRAVLPHMRKKQYGRIVNFASSSFKQPIDGLILSNTFRTGIIGLSKTLASELAKDGILINTIGPGRVATDRLIQLDQIRGDKLGISREEVRKQMETQIPLGRYGEPEEFAKAVVFFASGANTYITGQALLVDGGMVKAI
ncbi:SDR family oxidoreductase [Microaerobacter geothermalis]|uniref:SDR family oxidoreductase n=1 Tax=Microaerobacter geothermalis TaxID=674972 RepID=UPI001F351318|nr:SDR family oxidoreductase [Microaerobacter geothermalis]MCF6092662.1 SDR family oxidoreductase [Microaerobacter geothermalis]